MPTTKNPYRCPVCNKLGTKDLPEHICGSCDKSQFKDAVFEASGGSYMLINGALAEVNAKTVDSVRREDRRIVLNTIKRRKPVNRIGHVVKDNPSLEGCGHAFYNEPDEIKIEKGVFDIEHE